MFPFILMKLIYCFQPILVAERSVHGSGDYQSQAAHRSVSTWMGDRLANIYL